MGGQRSQVAALKRQALFDGIAPSGHDAQLIRATTFLQFSIDGFQVRSLWKRHEVVAASIPNQIFDASFLPSCMHIGKERLKAIDTVKVCKHFMFSSAMSLQHLEHGWLEVVIDHHAWHAVPELEGMALAEQEGFLPLGREAFHKHRPRKTQASSQERDFEQLAFDLDCRLAKVKLCPLAWSKVQRHEGGFLFLMLFLHIHAHR